MRRRGAKCRSESKGKMTLHIPSSKRFIRHRPVQRR